MLRSRNFDTDVIFTVHHNITPKYTYKNEKNTTALMQRNFPIGRIGFNSALLALQKSTKQYIATNCDKLFIAIIYGNAVLGLNSLSPYTPASSQITEITVVMGLTRVY